jgi:hypothetical protein
MVVERRPLRQNVIRVILIVPLLALHQHLQHLIGR